MDWITTWLASVPDVAVPLALAALGLIVTERSGVLSLGAEGFMLVGGLTAIGAHITTGHPVLALLLAMGAASLVSVVFAVMTIWLRINQIISGLAIVFFCEGGTSLLGTLLEWTNHPVAGLGVLHPGAGVLAPWLSRLLAQNAIVYLTPLIFAAVVAYLYRTTSGLRLRAVGENPQAADAAGIPVLRYRFIAVLAGAALMGLAGGYLSMVSTKLWIAGMTDGRGWIAIGLVIFARWSAWRALAGALLFGGIEALIPQLAASGIALPQYFLLMSPYLITLGVMVWVAVTQRDADGAPASIGEPYLREERR
ncbi:ABC transporter permease [Pararobbsia silviterrae]|uniref:ABC transporter permease n=1 Tax=Pararobbsia silviterrae TaxID=1792498 RepID=A0A494XST9_9BURK|nr:ABC transporter permease [Pararobbsia silviterrae]RKP53689.1 ABC transporter permease [Pararobbsia silviterrae]